MRQFHKFNNAKMVSGEICNEVLGEIILIWSNLNNLIYIEVLKFYREDIKNTIKLIFGNIYFHMKKYFLVMLILSINF